MDRGGGREGLVGRGAGGGMSLEEVWASDLFGMYNFWMVRQAAT